VELMNGIMRRKLSLLYEMHGLSEQAYGYVSEESLEPLGNIIEAKQELIREIDQLDRSFLFEFERLKSDLGLSSMEDLKKPQNPHLRDLQDNSAEIMGLLNKIDALDVKLNQGIVKLREDIAADLSRIRRQKQVSGMYSSDGERQQKGEQATGAGYGPRPAGGAAHVFDKRN